MTIAQPDNPNDPILKKAQAFAEQHADDPNWGTYEQTVQQNVNAAKAQAQATTQVAPTPEPIRVDPLRSAATAVPRRENGKPIGPIQAANGTKDFTTLPSYKMMMQYGGNAEPSAQSAWQTAINAQKQEQSDAALAKSRAFYKQQADYYDKSQQAREEARNRNSQAIGSLYSRAYKGLQEVMADDSVKPYKTNSGNYYKIVQITDTDGVNAARSQIGAKDAVKSVSAYIQTDAFGKPLPGSELQFKVGYIKEGNIKDGGQVFQSKPVTLRAAFDSIKNAEIGLGQNDVSAYHIVAKDVFPGYNPENRSLDLPSDISDSERNTRLNNSSKTEIANIGADTEKAKIASTEKIASERNETTKEVAKGNNETSIQVANIGAEGRKENTEATLNQRREYAIQKGVLEYLRMHPDVSYKEAYETLGAAYDKENPAPTTQVGVTDNDKAAQSLMANTMGGGVNTKATQSASPAQTSSPTQTDKAVKAKELRRKNGQQMAVQNNIATSNNTSVNTPQSETTTQASDSLTTTPEVIGNEDPRVTQARAQAKNMAGGFDAIRKWKEGVSARAKQEADERRAENARKERLQEEARKDALRGLGIKPQEASKNTPSKKPSKTSTQQRGG